MPLSSRWPPAAGVPEHGRRSSTWPPGSLNFDLRASAAAAAAVYQPSEVVLSAPVQHSASIPAVSAPPASSATSTAEEPFGGVDPQVAMEIVARAQGFMPSALTLRDYAAAHNLEAVLDRALNAVAKTRPAAPLRAVAEMLPPDRRVPVATLPSNPAGAGLERLRTSWLALHGMHTGVC
jgi:hypothetical protein